VGSTLGALLDRQAARLVGRDRERAALLRLVRDDVPVAMFVHGLAGVGKSALLAAFASDARERGAAVVSLDGRPIEPTERGFLDALAAKLRVLRREGVPTWCIFDNTTLGAGTANALSIIQRLEKKPKP